MRFNFKAVLFLFIFALQVISAQVIMTANVDKANPVNLEEIKYTITAENPSTVSPAVGVVVNCPVPRGIKFLEADPDQGSYNENTGVWNVGTVSPSSSVSLEITCIVNYFNSAWDVREYYNYNLLINDDINFTGTFVGGKVGAGGNISAIGTSIGGQLPTLSPVQDILNAKGYLNFSSGAVFTGNVVYGDSTNLPNSNVVYPHGSLVNGTPFDFGAYSAYAASLSAGLATHIINGSTTFSSNYLSLTGSDIYLNIFAVTTSDLDNSDSIVITIPKGSIGIVNVIGTTAEFIGNVNIVDNLNNFILFNFPTATNLSILGSRWQGAILAPFADINSTGTLVQGQVFANNLQTISSHQLHNFVGYIPLNRLINMYVVPNSGNPVVVPLNVNTTPPFGGAGNGSWSVSSLLPDSVWVLDLKRFDSNRVLAGTFTGRIYFLDNNGVIDTTVHDALLPASAIWSLEVNDSGHIFAATSNGLFRSNDTGATWTEHLPNLDVRSILFGLDSNYYAGTWGFGVYRSTDQGYTWEQKNYNIGSTVINTLMDKIDTNALSTPYTLFAGGFLKGLSASWDSADTWMPLAMPYEYVTDIAKSSDGILFIGTQTDGVYRSYDNGNTFHKLSGLPNNWVYMIKVDGDNNIFVSSWLNDIYASSDLGDTWTNLGLGGYGVSALYPGNDGIVMVATRSGQILTNQSGVSDIRGSVSPVDFNLEQNYPNPFNPETKISFSLPSQENVVIKLYNMAGQEISTLVNSRMDAGKHSLTLNAEGLASGIYLYRMTAGSFTSTKKLSILK